MKSEIDAAPPQAAWREQLHRLWDRMLAERRGAVAPQAREKGQWGAEVTLLRGLGVGLRETYAFLLERGPAFEDFVGWIAERNGGSLDPGRLARLDAALRGQILDDEGVPGEPVLSPEDVAFFGEHGYVVVHDAVSPAQCAAAERAIWTFLGMDRDDPATWYGNPHGHTIWGPLLHDPALREIRQAPRIRGAFAQLWKRGDLWATVDQVGFNPPERPGWHFPGPNLHWDTSLATPIPLGMQGILYLVDVAPDQGAFTCVPGFHRRIEDWLATLPAGADPRTQDLDTLGRVPVPGRAGDLIIWHHALPHGSSPNRAQRPRIVQYVSLNPSLWEREAPWK
jgi:hypothetical protein